MDTARSPDVLETEEWRPADRFIKYECSTLGRIRNATTKALLKKNIGPSGYSFVSLTKNDSRKHTTVRVTTIIARTFLGPIPPGMQVDHKIEGDKTNDRVSNLQLLSQ